MQPDSHSANRLRSCAARARFPDGLAILCRLGGGSLPLSEPDPIPRRISRSTVQKHFHVHHRLVRRSEWRNCRCRGQLQLRPVVHRHYCRRLDLGLVRRPKLSGIAQINRRLRYLKFYLIVSYSLGYYLRKFLCLPCSLSIHWGQKERGLVYQKEVFDLLVGGESKQNATKTKQSYRDLPAFRRSQDLVGCISSFSVQQTAKFLFLARN